MGIINLAIVGMGRMGITHYSIINSHPLINIESVVDPSMVVLIMMKKYLPVATFKDYHHIFRTKPPDAVLICTPPNLNYPIIKRAAELGIHVFAEKPFTTKYLEAQELNQLFFWLIGMVG